MNDPETGRPEVEGQQATPTSEAILAEIADVARQKLGWAGSMDLDVPLVETLALDSIRQLTLIVEIEDRFRICLDERDEAAVRTAGDLVDLIRRKRGRPATDAR